MSSLSPSQSKRARGLVRRERESSGSSKTSTANNPSNRRRRRFSSSNLPPSYQLRRPGEPPGLRITATAATAIAVRRRGQSGRRRRRAPAAGGLLLLLPLLPVLFLLALFRGRAHFFAEKNEKVNRKSSEPSSFFLSLRGSSRAIRALSRVDCPQKTRPRPCFYPSSRGRGSSGLLGPVVTREQSHRFQCLLLRPSNLRNLNLNPSLLKST